MTSQPDTESIEYIFKLFEETNAKLKLSESKNIVLFLGDTGSGKTTLFHLIGKDNRNLKSIQINPGEFLFEADDGSISQNTTISQTSIPELIEDVSTKTAFYDCPGFGDTRNIATDIANSYSIDKLFNHGCKFKIILVIKYHSVRHGVDRKSFIELIRNVSNIIKDVNRYKDSIAAVITQVENIPVCEGGVLGLVPDHDILNGITTFLANVKQEIPPELPYYENAINLINIFLTDGDYERLVIFRRPVQQGPVHEIDIIQNSKILIRTLISDKMIFKEKSPDDFGYTISFKTENTIIVDLVTKINENIVGIMQEISKHMLAIYKTRENDTNDIQEQTDQFIQIHNSFVELTNNITKHNMTLVNVISAFRTLSEVLNLDMQNLLTNLTKYNQQFLFLNKVSKNDLAINNLEWISGLNDFRIYVNDSKEWYLALSDIFTKLSKYEIQKNTKKFQINEIETKYRAWISQKLVKTGGDFQNLFETIYSDDLENQNSPSFFLNIKNVKVNDIKIQKLLDILIYTLKSDVKYITTDPTKDQIRGIYIKISDIPLNILSSNKKFLEIFSSHTIYIDKDLNFEGMKQKLIIASPELTIVDKRTINLNGINRDSQVKANDGLFHGSRGEDGQPGYPGGAAGTIFAVARHFTNIEDLTVTTNGGNGGDGQDGGDGETGENGIDPTLPIDKFSIISPETQIENLGFRCEARTDLHKKPDGEFSQAIDLVLNVTTEYYFDIFGSDAQAGGCGGDGGYRGEKGAKGKICFINLKCEPKLLNYNSVDGNLGKCGNGGNGGLGGINGKKFLAKYTLFRIPYNVQGVVLAALGPLAATVKAILALTPLFPTFGDFAEAASQTAVVAETAVVISGAILSAAATSATVGGAIAAVDDDADSEDDDAEVESPGTRLGIWEIVEEFSQGTQQSGSNGSNNHNRNGYENAENTVEIENISNIIQEYKVFLIASLHNSVKKHILTHFIQKIDEHVF